MVARGVSVSVIIPALDEQSTIARALRSTERPGVERIVVDGGSQDGTGETARFLRAEKVIHSLPGRARQMDAGYREARGEIVLFLHADTALGPGWLEALAEVAADPEVAGGAFRLRFAAEGRRFRLLERAVALRCRLFRLPFGDQALFVRRKLLDEWGGFAPVPIFEDLDLVARIRARGRLAMLPVAAETSARRYQRNGVVRTTTRHQLALAAWKLGWERERVARWYRGRPPR